MWPGSPRSKWAELLSKLFKGSYIVFHLGVIVYKEDAINTATHLTKTTTTSNQVPLSLSSKIISQMIFFIEYAFDHSFPSDSCFPTEIKFLILFSAAAHENSTQPAVGMKNVKRITNSFLEVAPRSFVRGWRLF